MASSFPLQLCASPGNDVVTRQYKVDGAATFILGELVYWDTSAKTLKGCGANPTLIAGIGKGAAALALGTQWPGPLYLPDFNTGGTASTPVDLLGANNLCFISSTTTPLIDHIGVDYGIASVAGVWQLNISDTTNKRAIVLDICLGPGGQEGYLVRFDPKYLQFSGVMA